VTSPHLFGVIVSAWLAFGLSGRWFQGLDGSITRRLSESVQNDDSGARSGVKTARGSNIVVLPQSGSGRTRSLVSVFPCPWCSWSNRS